jgi:hypothetical protein
MTHVHGQPLGEPELERLIVDLTNDGGPDAIAAATEVLRAYAHDRYAARLDFDTREAIYFVLAADEDLPEGLQQLRDALGRCILAQLKL